MDKKKIYMVTKASILLSVSLCVIAQFIPSDALSGFAVIIYFVNSMLIARSLSYMQADFADIATGPTGKIILRTFVAIVNGLISAIAFVILTTQSFRQVSGESSFGALIFTCYGVLAVIIFGSFVGFPSPQKPQQ